MLNRVKKTTTTTKGRECLIPHYFLCAFAFQVIGAKPLPTETNKKFQSPLNNFKWARIFHFNSSAIAFLCLAFHAAKHFNARMQNMKNRNSCKCFANKLRKICFWYAAERINKHSWNGAPSRSLLFFNFYILLIKFFPSFSAYIPETECYKNIPKCINMTIELLGHRDVIMRVYLVPSSSASPQKIFSKSEIFRKSFLESSSWKAQKPKNDRRPDKV